MNGLVRPWTQMVESTELADSGDGLRLTYKLKHPLVKPTKGGPPPYLFRGVGSANPCWQIEETSDHLENGYDSMLLKSLSRCGVEEGGVGINCLM